MSLKGYSWLLEHSASVPQSVIDFDNAVGVAMRNYRASTVLEGADKELVARKIANNAYAKAYLPYDVYQWVMQQFGG